MHLSKIFEMLGNSWTGITSTNFKADINLQEMTESLKTLDINIENLG